jgi:tRNA(Arg) A34 adenosine deaminase TadA
MFHLTPGVRSVASFIEGSTDAASRAVTLAEASAARGSFGVGGILVTADGHVVAEATNAVIRNGRVQDPTAHVERQLIDWYFS